MIAVWIRPGRRFSNRHTANGHPAPGGIAQGVLSSREGACCISGPRQMLLSISAYFAENGPHNHHHRTICGDCGGDTFISSPALHCGAMSNKRFASAPPRTPVDGAEQNRCTIFAVHRNRSRTPSRIRHVVTACRDDVVPASARHASCGAASGPQTSCAAAKTWMAGSSRGDALRPAMTTIESNERS